MQLTGTIGDTTYTLAGSAGSLEGPEFLVKAFENCADDAAVLEHARKLFGESLKLDEGEPAPPEGRPATDPERRAVAQGTPNQVEAVSVAETQIQEHLKAEEESPAPPTEAPPADEEPAPRSRRSRE